MVEIIRQANRLDMKKILHFLEDAKLSIEGVEENIEHFVLSEDERGNITAVLGLEPVLSIGVLRSLAVRSKINEEELAILFQHVYNLAKSKKLSTLFLLTNKESFLPLLQCMGFQHTANNSIPSELEFSSHVKNINSLKDVFFMQRAIY